MPYIAVLRYGLPVMTIGDSSITALSKDFLVGIFIVFGILVISVSRRPHLFDRIELTTCILLLMAIIRTIASTATATQSISALRHEFIFAAFALVLYRLCRTNIITTYSIHRIFSVTLAINMIVVIGIGYAELYNKEILGMLYGEKANNLVTGIPGIPQIRSVSTLENPINLALFLTIGINYFALLCQRIKATHLTVVTLAIPLVVATLSRSFIIFYFIVFAIVNVRFFIGASHKGRIALAATFIILISALINSASINVDDIAFSSILEKRLEQTIDSISSKDDPRFENWGKAIHELNSYPVIGQIAGLGLGVSNPGDFETGQFRIENSFLTIYLQIGIIGLVLFLLPFLIAFRRALKHKSNSANRHLAIVITILIGGLTNDTHRNMPFSFYLWICFALAALWIKLEYQTNKATWQKNCVN